MRQISPESLATIVRTKMSIPLQPSAKPYTLTLSTPSQGTPTFLRHLQQSDSNPLWLGKDVSFLRKHNPSTWPWQHAMLNAGHNLKLPTRCTTVQTWSFEIEADEAFVADLEIFEAAHDVPVCKCHSILIKPKHLFCVMNFLTFQTPEAEQKYRQHLATAVEQLDMSIRITGRILKSEENLSVHAKIPAVKASKKKNKFRAQKPFARVEDDAGASQPPVPMPTFFALLSFSSSTEHVEFLARKSRDGGEDGVLEEVVTTQHLVLPPKGQPISTGDWSYGNPHEPYGQDWFG
jgi:hypothetical protein